MNERTYSDILDECLGRVLARGESIEACVADYPAHAAGLRHDLSLATDVREAAAFQPDADRKRIARMRMLDALDRKARPSLLSRWNPLRAMPSAVPRLAAVAAALAIALIGGGTGTVLASTGAVPGDALYPLKRAAERTQLALSFTDAREANLRERFLDRRVEELDTVTETGRERFVPELAAQIGRHAERASALASAPVDAAVPGQSGEAPARDVVEVPVEALAALNARLAQLEGQIDQLLARIDNPSAQQALTQAKTTVGTNREAVGRVLDRADRVAVVVPPDDVREIDAAVLGRNAPDPRPTPTPAPVLPGVRPVPTPTPRPTPEQAAQLRSVEAVLLEAEFELHDGVGQIELKVRTRDGKEHKVEASLDRVRLLKGAEPATVHDLVRGAQLRAFFDPTGAIRAIQVVPPPNAEPRTSDEVRRVQADLLNVTFGRADNRVVAQVEFRVVGQDEPRRTRLVEGQVRIVADGRQVPISELAPHQRVMLVFSVEQERIVQVVIVERGEDEDDEEEESGALRDAQRDARNLSRELDGLQRDLESLRTELDV